jgi:hypothetical protein
VIGYPARAVPRPIRYRAVQEGLAPFHCFLPFLSSPLSRTSPSSRFHLPISAGTARCLARRIWWSAGDGPVLAKARAGSAARVTAPVPRHSFPLLWCIVSSSSPSISVEPPGRPPPADPSWSSGAQTADGGSHPRPTRLRLYAVILLIVWSFLACRPLLLGFLF